MSGLAIVCSGQGKQDYESFAALLAYPELESLFRHFMDSGIIPDRLKKYLESPDKNPELIFENEAAQPFIVMQQIMVWELIKNSIPDVQIFAGYSLGELSAYALAGIMKCEDALRLAAIRGRLMSSSFDQPQKMAAVIGLRKNTVENICSENAAFISIINSESHFICGMPAEKFANFMDECKNSGAERVVELPITIASHSPYMKNAAIEFEKELRKISLADSGADILAGVSGEKLFTKEDMIKTLTAQMANTLDWRACMESAYSYDCRIFLETGPGSALSKMLLESLHHIEARSVSDFHDIHMVKNWIDSASKRQG